VIPEVNKSIVKDEEWERKLAQDDPAGQIGLSAKENKEENKGVRNPSGENKGVKKTKGSGTARKQRGQEPFGHSRMGKLGINEKAKGGQVRAIAP